MMIHWREACFIKSAYKHIQFPADVGCEVAFVGRSNAGKSSLINALCGRRQLCKVGKAPGKTRLVNFFALSDQHRLVDLPGYGYAQVTHTIRDHWRVMIESYLTVRQSLVLLVVVMDIRHPVQEKDIIMLHWAQQQRIPVYVVLTKSDKISQMQANKQCALAHKNLAHSGIKATGVQIFSALRKQGIDALAQHIEKTFDQCYKQQSRGIIS